MEVEMDFLEERYGLAIERIRQIAEEGLPGDDQEFDAYFRKMALFLLQIDENRSFLRQDGLLAASVQELLERNHALYRDVMPENYEESYGNPAYAVSKLGLDFGRLLSFLHRELYSLIVFCYEEKLEEIVIRMELFVELYGLFAMAVSEEGLPKLDEVKKTIYWFISDYSDVSTLHTVEEQTVPGKSTDVSILNKAEDGDLRYLFAYGEYIGENELGIARFLMGLPQEKIDLMADTYTEGYRIGFELTGKDLSKKKTAEVIYPIGFERMMRRAVANIEKMNLSVVGRDGSMSILSGESSAMGTSPNRQYDFDHRDDLALFFDKALAERKLEVYQTALEEHKDDARGHAGPAVVEGFGEKDFDPVNKPEAARMSEEQNETWVDYRMRRRQLQCKYIPEEERSFTIIAFPIPEIRSALPKDDEETYQEFFEEVIRINTLNYQVYRDIQAKLINALDQADYCEIKGMNGNRTDLRINLYKLKDPSKETIFENCVADVNIPVGEVFTSPVLQGTNGLLHVSKVFLNGLEYRDLTIQFENGWISDYNCGNFQLEKENKEFVRDNVLYRHKSLPIGEFAIGTNTTAYMVARKYKVEAKLPILIAEKTGPHFAVGDTCYSQAEDVKVYNPDGKEIVARDNEVSILRKTDPSKAYLNCHTDITIPYNELGELSAITKEGKRIPIISQGRFVLPGTEELNKPLDEV